MSHLEIIQKAKVFGKIGKVSSFKIGNDGLNAKGYFAIFKFAISIIDNQDLFNAFTNENIYTNELDNMSSNELVYLVTINEFSWLWHRRFGHANTNLHSNLSKHELVKGLLDTKLVKDKIGNACQIGK